MRNEPAGSTPATDSTTDADLETALHQALTRIDELETKTARLETTADRLESELERRTTQLESELETKTERIAELEDALHHARTRLEDCESRTDQQTRLAEAACKKAETNKQRLAELQSRELEKGAHLRTTHVDEHELEITGDLLERITKADDRTYYRLPEQADPLERTATTLAYGDLLPIQQLARMDDDMRRSAANALPTRLAATLWQARTDASVGDNPWKTGCKTVAEYVTASDLKHWIRRQEAGVSDTYAKKLVSRVIDALLDLSKHRVAVRKRTERKNGLEYTERRLVLPTDAEVPGETGGED
ncbi:hypothetical protein [Natronolimnobius baerhuensis]|uniref:Uncharacterized protein n=1 Tax=Natronolimnobius baerhuensis TaxID=253108 RepID=A0A202E5F4_9EURY|nr:hypothetical protein [Natronolimnobius baerhuensis]OVE83130.1 hypothetical protein B2G88_17115 [Natronolimnobius baerhuensis]